MLGMLRITSTVGIRRWTPTKDYKSNCSVILLTLMQQLWLCVASTTDHDTLPLNVYSKFFIVQRLYVYYTIV